MTLIESFTISIVLRLGILKVKVRKGMREDAKKTWFHMVRNKPNSLGPDY